eukprot:1050417-Rhodomonas_salina.1
MRMPGTSVWVWPDTHAHRPCTCECNSTVTIRVHQDGSKHAPRLLGDLPGQFPSNSHRVCSPSTMSHVNIGQRTGRACAESGDHLCPRTCSIASQDAPDLTWTAGNTQRQHKPAPSPAASTLRLSQRTRSIPVSEPDITRARIKYRM